MDTNLKIFAPSKSLNVVCATENTNEKDLELIVPGLSKDFDNSEFTTKEQCRMKIFIRTKNLNTFYFMKITETRGTIVFMFKDEILNLKDVSVSDYKSIFKKLEFTTKNRFLSAELMKRSRFVLGKE